MTALVIAEHDNHHLKNATLNALTAAQECATQVHIMVMGSGSGSVAAQAAALAGVAVYPNPASNSLFVDFKGTAVDGKIIIRLFDMNGRVLLENASTSVTGEKLALDINQVQDGIYLLQISENEASAYRKVIVAR